MIAGEGVLPVHVGIVQITFGNQLKVNPPWLTYPEEDTTSLVSHHPTRQVLIRKAYDTSSLLHGLLTASTMGD